MSDDEDGGQSRSERLRERRQGRDDTQQMAEPSDTSQPSKLSQTDEMSKTSKLSVKEERVGTYMYLTESQKKEIDHLYNVLKTDFEYEYDIEFEKNRHFFPLVVQYGLEDLDKLDASDIKNRLDSI